MTKKVLPLLIAPLLLAGCTTTFTNLTPAQQSRNPDNQYRVEVAMASRQQSLRWETIKPQIVVGNNYYPMRPTPLMTNRWEGWVPVPAAVDLIHYRYKFEFNYNDFGKPGVDSSMSPEYTLKVQ